MFILNISFKHLFTSQNGSPKNEILTITKSLNDDAEKEIGNLDFTI